MNTSTEHHHFTLEPFEARRFANLCGQFDEHLRLIEQRLAVEIRNRGNQFACVARRTAPIAGVPVGAGRRESLGLHGGRGGAQS